LVEQAALTRRIETINNQKMQNTLSHSGLDTCTAPNAQCGASVCPSKSIRGYSTSSNSKLSGVLVKTIWVSSGKESAMLHEVVGAMLIRSGRVLLGQRSASREFYPGVWDVFGGHREPGEGLEETLVRELQEELGITPTQWSYLGTITIPASADELILHLYRVTAWEGMPQNRQLEEHSTIGWFSLAEAVQLPLADPGYRELFERYLNA
jgi:8-oxo-dGTP diphosphatase